jgi:hypothetical protein
MCLAAVETFLAPGRHGFAPLPGGLRRSAKTRSFTAILVSRRAIGDGWAGNTDPLGASDLVLRTRQQLRLGRTRAERREPPGRRAARCERRTDALAQTCSAAVETFLAPGRHAFASLPGGLRRSAKTRSFTAILVYRRAVGDGWAGGTNPLRESDLALRTSQRLRLDGTRAERREPPGPRAARCERRTDALAKMCSATGATFLAPGRHGFAPLPGGLRRSAKTRVRLPPSSFTAEP